jgi:hypothetical protein
MQNAKCGMQNAEAPEVEVSVHGGGQEIRGRVAKAGHSRADVVAKCEIALKEARETHYWLRLLAETAQKPGHSLPQLIAECDEIMRIIGAIIVATRRKSA